MTLLRTSVLFGAVLLGACSISNGDQFDLLSETPCGQPDFVASPDATRCWTVGGEYSSPRDVLAVSIAELAGSEALEDLGATAFEAPSCVSQTLSQAGVEFELSCTAVAVTDGGRTVGIATASQLYESDDFAAIADGGEIGGFVVGFTPLE